MLLTHLGVPPAKLVTVPYGPDNTDANGNIHAKNGISTTAFQLDYSTQIRHLTSGTWLSLDTRPVVGAEFLSRCRRLEWITLQDGALEYQPQEVVQYRCLPSRLPRVESLVLCGWSALTFHPDTLYSTQRLVKLSLSTCTRTGNEPEYFIASTMENHQNDNNDNDSSNNDEDAVDKDHLVTIIVGPPLRQQQQRRWKWD